jgi:hypothetical protein
MNTILWTLLLIAFVSLLHQGLELHQASVCRSRAWLKSSELLTSTLLTGEVFSPVSFESSCKLRFIQKGQKIRWFKPGEIQGQIFDLNMRNSP